MERNHQFGTLPPEVWCHILSYTQDINDVVDQKFVNRLFYHELASRDPFKALDSSLKISKECIKHLTSRDTLYSLPREYLYLAQRSSISVVHNNEFHFKTIFLGASGVGKSAFLTSFVKGRFEELYEGTIGCAFFTKKLVDQDRIATKFELWDTAGQERFASLSPIYYRHARAVLLCFSIDDRKSLVSLLTRFLPEVCNSFKSNNPEDQPVMYLLGLKSDLEGKRDVSTTEAKFIARALKMKYFECSAKLGHNVNEVMESLKDDLLKAVRVPGLEVPAPVRTPERPKITHICWCSIQ